MPLNPARVQAIFLEAANDHDATNRDVILDREYAGDSELRQRIEALLSVHDRLNDVVNQTLEGPDDRSTSSSC